MVDRVKCFCLAVFAATAGCTDLFGLGPVGETGAGGSGTTASGGGGTSSSTATGGSGGSGASGGSGGALPGVHAVDIDVGSYNACMVVALDATANEVRCWGAYDDGLLPGASMDIGDASGEKPVTVAFESANPLQVRVGARHACALLEGGKVRCWGNDSRHQLGNGNLAVSITFAGDAKVEQLAVGGYFSCVLSTDHDVHCWGNNSQQQLGIPADGDYLDPMKVDLGPGQKATSIDVGYDFACAVLAGGKVKCWGNNSARQCGHPLAEAHVSPSAAVAIAGDFVAVTAGGYHACGRAAGGTVQCWGSNDNGQLGAEKFQDSSELPLEAKLGYEVTQISGGLRHACAILHVEEGAQAVIMAKCWGANNLGQRGTGDTLSTGEMPGSMGKTLAAVKLPASFAVSRVVAGNDSSCALSANGQVTCWGANENGRLGLGLPVAENMGDEAGEMGDGLVLVPLE